MSEAHSQHRHAWPERLDELDANPGFSGRAWPRRNDHVGRAKRVDIGNGDFVIAPHHRLAAQFSNQLHEVPGERVVVVEDEDHVRQGSGPTLIRKTKKRSAGMPRTVSPIDACRGPRPRYLLSQYATLIRNVLSGCKSNRSR